MQRTTPACPAVASHEAPAAGPLQRTQCSASLSTASRTPPLLRACTCASERWAGSALVPRASVDACSQEMGLIWRSASTDVAWAEVVEHAG